MNQEENERQNSFKQAMGKIPGMKTETEKAFSKIDKLKKRKEERKSLSKKMIEKRDKKRRTRRGKN